MIYYVDIDGTICTQENKNEASDYSKAEPRQNQIAKINFLLLNCVLWGTSSMPYPLPIP